MPERELQLRPQRERLLRKQRGQLPEPERQRRKQDLLHKLR